MKAMLIAALCTLALLGCKTDSAPTAAPIVRGEVINPGASRITLSQQQLAGCIEWLTAHQEVWGKLRALPPSPVQTVTFTHSDGARTQIEFYTGRPGWGNRLVVRSFDKNGDLQLTGVDDFSESDITALKTNLLASQ
jgi:hypothetical protein